MSYNNDIKDIYNFIKVWKIEIYMFIFMHNHIICHKFKNGVWMDQGTDVWATND
jgi:hypothetical protein